MNTNPTTTQNSNITSTQKNDVNEEEDIQLPGFRFHPTDQELVGFYLRRKVEKKPIRLGLIKQVDIYKSDPWDLPRPSGVEDKEGYFFCKRGRKYRNSVRPNRVTGSGFWKATGIDKPVHSNKTSITIGLKKTLVYYRGSAGKGTKTDWMMHEFRLPGPGDLEAHRPSSPSASSAHSLSMRKNPSSLEAEVWTLCRIFKRNATYRKYTADWRQMYSKRQQIDTNATTTSSTKTGKDVVNTNNNKGTETYVSFCGNNDIEAPILFSFVHQQQNENKPFVYNLMNINGEQWNSSLPIINTGTTSTTTTTTTTTTRTTTPTPSMASCSSDTGNNILLKYDNVYGATNDQFSMDDEDWNELRSVVDQFAFNHH